MTGLESPSLFLLGPAGCEHPADPSCAFVSWQEVAEWFDDVPGIADYIRHSAFFYGGSWKTMVSPVSTPPGKTAWDLMREAPSPSHRSAGEMRHQEAAARPSPVGVRAQPGDSLDPWSFHHLGHGYFAQIIEGCRLNGIWPLRTIWTGVTGVAYAEKAKGRRIDPNWMVEDGHGRRYTRSGGFEKPHSYNAGRMRGWSYEEIARYFGFETE